MTKDDNSRTAFDLLRERYSRDWSALADARDRTMQRLRELRSLTLPQSDNTAMVVFGSFARGELTSGSDMDWSLLIDGPADPEHFLLGQEIRRKLVNANLPEPGTTETFGTLASSHELIHHIGGTRDTNQNMTRRILLLLESRAINNEIVHERVLRGVLNRYIISGQSVSWRGQPSVVVPRFLLNDIVRFWRTMAVDYAAKKWEQPYKKWALRNAKLRMSRKLLFVAGLLLCFSFELDPPQNREEILDDESMMPASLADFLLERVKRKPIDVLCRLLLRQPNQETVLDILDSYDRFLGLLNDEDKRDRLATLPFEVADLDDLFSEVRALSDRFQEGLTSLFYRDDEKLRDLIVKYGVF
jgi:predicted nucleotidyltransferase